MSTSLKIIMKKKTIALCLCALSVVTSAKEPLTAAESVVDKVAGSVAENKPMEITAGSDVPWQVDSPEEASKAFKATGELHGTTERFKTYWQENGKRFAEHGVTAYESYAKWMLMEPNKGEWDPSFFDDEMAIFKENGLKWVPFLIAGPAYSTPPWFKESEESVFAKDIETGDVSRDQSIWNPHIKPRIRHWLKQFFNHYAHDDMQSVVLGISGVFGEAIYTANGNLWTTIWDGEYPQHLGWWAGDSYAEADFRAVMQNKYQTIEQLNNAWQTDITSFDEVKPFVPDDKHLDRARLDMTRWYMSSMVDYAEWWTKTVREFAPTLPIMLITGGDARPQLGADMSAQTKMAAKYNAGIRITNEASDYAMNFYLTRHIGSSARLYDTYFGYEPAGPVDENGITARIYNAVASGATELFHYDRPPSGARGERYKRDLDLMNIQKPEVEVAMLWSRTSADLMPMNEIMPQVISLNRGMRDLADFDFIDELMIEDGALSQNRESQNRESQTRVLVWGTWEIIEQETADRIQTAVRNGLTLIVPAGFEPRTPEGELVFPAQLIDNLSDEAPLPVVKEGKGQIVFAGDTDNNLFSFIGNVMDDLSDMITGENSSSAELAATLALVLQSPQDYGVTGLAAETSLDAKMDGVYLTVTETDFLYYNHGDKAQAVQTMNGSKNIPAQSIVRIKRNK